MPYVAGSRGVYRLPDTAAAALICCLGTLDRVGTGAAAGTPRARPSP